MLKKDEVIGNLDLDILRELAYDISLLGVFADKELGRAKFSIEDTVAAGNGASNLTCAFPDNLGEVRGDGVAGVVLRNFIRP
jgi:hypothetical protein